MARITAYTVTYTPSMGGVWFDIYRDGRLWTGGFATSRRQAERDVRIAMKALGAAS